jgi:biopolymer transport protein ExbD
MAFLFECPQCGDRRRLARQSLGRKMRCPSCESLIEVQLPEDDPAFDMGSYIATVTAESAEAKLKVITGVAITPPAPPAWKRDNAAEAMPGVPVLAMDDEEDVAQKIIVKSKPEEAEMDMTPMVDVTFLLLIFFMVTASFTVQKSLEVPPPQEKEEGQITKVEEKEDDSDFITIRVDQFSTFHVLSSHWDDEIECPSEQELLVRLREAHAPDPQGNVPSKLLVKAHGDATNERVVMAVDAGVHEGIDNVEVQTVETDEE